MPYIGGILSENSYKYLTKGTKPIVKMWMRELKEKVEQLEIPVAEEYEIGVFGRFYDDRRPDLSNLHKVIGDALKKALPVDDKYYRFVDLGCSTGFINPELEITIRPIEEVKNEVKSGW